MFIKGNIYFGRKCHPGAKRKRCSETEMNIPIKGGNWHCIRITCICFKYSDMKYPIEKVLEL